jgi:hypothetical protein
MGLECEDCKNSLICQMDNVYSVLKKHGAFIKIVDVKDKVLFYYIDDPMHRNDFDRLQVELKRFGCLGIVIMGEEHRAKDMETLSLDNLVLLRDNINKIIAKKHLTDQTKNANL